jgi:tetratricopeptide (TPR) repeat protein
LVGSPSEILKRGYSDAEVKDLYAFGRHLYSMGRYNDAKTVFEALSNIVPSYLSAWLGLCAVQIQLSNREQAVFAARQAYRLGPDLPLVLLLLIIALLGAGDYTAAGTYLGEFGEKVDAQQVTDSRLVRLYRAQINRYRSGTRIATEV